MAVTTMIATMVKPPTQAIMIQRMRGGTPLLVPAAGGRSLDSVMANTMVSITSICQLEQ